MALTAQRGRCGRPGYILPFALVATFISMMIVGASARYCTTSMATSNEYLSRTRCRLAAQSAIEQTKVLINGASQDRPIADVASGSYGATLAEVFIQVKSSSAFAEKLEEFHRRDPNLRVFVDLVTDEKKGVSTLYATGEYTMGRRKTTVTLQECCVIPRSDSNIFLYAYFANGDGHLISEDLVINGDVRCNGDFHISGAQINGFIYASNEVNIAEKNISNWWNGRYVTAREAYSYNRAFRTGEYSSKARPTNPLSNRKEWVGGYEPIDNPKKDMNLLERIISGIGDLITAIANRDVYADGEWPICKKDNKRLGLVWETAKGDVLVNDKHSTNPGYLAMPRILPDRQPETEVDKHLDYYKRLAASALTPKGNVGGSLICSNCYLAVDGSRKQHEVKLRLDLPPWDETIHHERETIHHDTTITHVPEETIHHEAVTKEIHHAEWSEPMTAEEIRANGNIPVYEWERYLTIALSRTEKLSEWEQDVDGFTVSSSSAGSYFFDKRDFDAIADAHYKPTIGVDRARTEYKQHGWSEVETSILQRYCYHPKRVVGYVRLKIEEGIEEYSTWSVSYEFVSFGHESDFVPAEERLLAVRSIPLYEYNTSNRSGWQRVGRGNFLSPYDPGYQDTTTAKKFNGLFMKVDAASEVADEIAADYEMDSDELLSSIRDRGWSQRTSGSYHDSLVSGYLIVNVYQVLKNGSPTLEVRTSFAKTKAADFDPTKKYTDTVPVNYLPVYQYKERLDWYDYKKNWTEVTSRNLVYRNRSASSPYYNYAFYSADLSKAANAVHQLQREIPAGDVTALFAANKDGWDGGNTRSGYRSNYPIGYFKFTPVEEPHQRSIYTTNYKFLDPEDEELHIFHPAYDETIVEKEPWDEIIPAHDVEEGTPWDEVIDPWDETITHPAENNVLVTRAVRGIFVKDGYKVVADPTYRLPGSASPLVVADDLRLTAEKTLAEGDTTAKLRPFREDQQYGCNRKADADEGAVILIGTWDSPIVIDGPVVFESDVLIRGFVSGRGTIYSGRNIHIIGDINYKNPPFWPDDGGEPDTKGRDQLMLVSRGSIVIGNYVKIDGKYVDRGWEQLLSGNYINGYPNASDPQTKFGRNGNAVPYVTKNYTQSDSSGNGSYKVRYNANNLDREPVKYYESVVGDYVFMSIDVNDTAEVMPAADEKVRTTSPYCSSRLTQAWDCNFGHHSNVDAYMPYASFQSGAIEQYANSQNWGVTERIGAQDGSDGKSFREDLWGKEKNTFVNYVRNRYTYRTGSSNRPRLDSIQAINAVLYSSEGIYGTVGATKTPCTINGAVIAQDEALLPFARIRRLLFGIITRAEDLSITINWDIRLNLQSADSEKNDEDDEGYGQLIKSESQASGDIRVLSWQEVPDSFNPAYVQ